ncbi:cytochrome P450 [Lipomyces japonicus]|uniref:cytochrome P450 n=1 Tax=Lipomyces japonicus TaxID=56871 RepID=UPI0034CE1309
MTLYLVVVAAVVAVIVFKLSVKLDVFLAQRRFAKSHGTQDAPSLGGDAFGLQNFLRMKRAMDRNENLDLLSSYFSEWTHSSTFRSRLVGAEFFNTIDPENIKAILSTKFADFDLGLRHDAFYPLLGDGIFTLDNEGWSHSRALLKPQFTRQQVSDVAALEKHVQNLIELLPADGTVVDLQALFYKFTLDASTEFLFGDSVESLRAVNPSVTNSDNNEKQNQSRQYVSAAGKADFATAFDLSQATLAKRIVFQKFYWLVNPAKFQTANQTVHKFVDSYVSKALALSQDGKDHQSDRYVFLEALVQDTRDPKVLRDQLLNILLAGRDTTATLLSWTFYLLARHPRVLEKLRSALLEDFGPTLNHPGKKQINFETLKSCTYLRYVLNEVLRLYPSVPQNFRIANKHTVLPRGGGPDGTAPVFVRKGQKIFYSVYIVHRRTDLFGPDADQFRPERWSEGKAWAWEYLPFNGGPRICLGQQYALTEAGYVITRLLQLFDTIQPGDDEDKPLKKGLLTLSHVNGVHVSLKKTT